MAGELQCHPRYHRTLSSRRADDAPSAFSRGAGLCRDEGEPGGRHQHVPDRDDGKWERRRHGRVQVAERLDLFRLTGINA